MYLIIYEFSYSEHLFRKFIWKIPKYMSSFMILALWFTIHSQSVVPGLHFILKNVPPPILAKYHYYLQLCLHRGLHMVFLYLLLRGVLCEKGNVVVKAVYSCNGNIKALFFLAIYNPILDTRISAFVLLLRHAHGTPPDF